MLDPKNATQPRQSRTRMVSFAVGGGNDATVMATETPFARMNDNDGIVVKTKAAPVYSPPVEEPQESPKQKRPDVEEGGTPAGVNESVLSLSTCSMSSDEDSGVDLGSREDNDDTNTPTSPSRAYLNKVENKLEKKKEIKKRGPNSCAICLLFLALVLLVLVMLAKASNRHEQVAYDAQKDEKNYSSPNREVLHTIQLLVVGLMSVLLLGSVCYFFEGLDAYQDATNNQRDKKQHLYKLQTDNLQSTPSKPNKETTTDTKLVEECWITNFQKAAQKASLDSTLSE